MRHKLTTKEFIEKAKKIHGSMYDYSLVKYINNNTKISIICKKCKKENRKFKFWQKPRSHICDKQGCPICKYKIKTTEQLIKEAKKVHGNKYDYSKTKYIKWNKNILIICKKCKKENRKFKFWQRATHHLEGVNCPRCARNKRIKTTEQFIKEAKKVHGNKYDYSKTKYIGSRTKVAIISPQYGLFWKKPYQHLNGEGCQKEKGIILKGNKWFASVPDAYYYLHLLKRGLKFKKDFTYNKYYDKSNKILGKKRYDFYIFKENKYIEITSYNRKWPYIKKYLKRIKEKEKYVKKYLNANFELIQLSPSDKKMYKCIHSFIQT